MAFATRCGFAADPWQAELLRTPHSRALLCCSRQSGKTHVVAALALHHALFAPRARVIITAPSLRQSATLLDRARDLRDAVGRGLPEIDRGNSTRLRLSNGSEILALPGGERYLRSKTATLLIIDEAAQAREDLYRTVRPTLASTGGRLIMLSTPFGRRGFYHQAWADQSQDWHRVRVPWQQCPRITPEFIAQERRECGESWVRQEYECSFEALEGLVYPDFADQVTATASHERQPAGRRVGGIDFGYRNPFAAIWGDLDADGILWLEGERYVTEQPITEHATHLPKDVTWWADPAGADQIATLRRLNLKVQPADHAIASGIAAVRRRLECRTLKVENTADSPCKNLMEEATLYRYPPTRAGAPESDSPIDEHNHACDALRYLISGIDAGWIKGWKSKVTSTGPKHTAAAPAPPSAAAATTHAAAAPSKRQSLLHDPNAWTHL